MLTASSVASAQGWAPQARRLFERDEYQRCIDLLEPHRKNVVAAMFLGFSHLQESVFNGKKYDKEKWKSYRDYIEARMSPDNIKDLLYFVEFADKPPVVKEARKLAGKAFKAVKDMSEISRLTGFLDSSDEDTRELALKAIERNLSLKRKYVNKGGTLRRQDVEVMDSNRLIRKLLDHIEDKGASKALLQIESPVLAHLSRYNGEAYLKLETSIHMAIAKREKKYPDSSWASATGKSH